MENNTILEQKTSMKVPVTLNVTVEGKQLYLKLKNDPSFSLSDLVDKLIKEEAKKRKVKL
jgi:hypothetical protein